MRQKTFQTRYISCVLLALTCLLTACSGGGSSSEELDPPAPNPTPSPTPENQEIKLNASVWNMMEGMRATFYDLEALKAVGFRAHAYVNGTTTPYINPTNTNVTWNSTPPGEWEFTDGKHYWPAEGSLDFFAYMPATVPTYITGPTYSAPGEPGVPQAQFTCTLPMVYNATSPEAGQGSSLQEFIWGITVAQNKANQGATGVTMKFRHPFARLKFQLAASHPNVQINSITFKKLKTGGTCTLNNTAIADTYYYTTSAWSSLTPAEGGSNLVMTLASKDNDDKWITAPVNTFNDNPASVVPIGGYSGGVHQYVNLLVVPQTFAGEIEVNASWTEWGEAKDSQTLTATVPTNWQSGYSYTYTFTITEFDLIVDIAKFTEQW